MGLQFITKQQIIVTVSCLYRKPRSTIDSFYENVEKIFGNIHKNKTLFLCGYFNGLYPIMNKPTRITRSTATLINNIFTNTTNKQTTSGIIISDITVHFPVFTLCENAVTKRNLEAHIYIRNHATISMTSFVEDLRNEMWENNNNATDVNRAYDSLNK